MSQSWKDSRISAIHDREAPPEVEESLGNAAGVSSELRSMQALSELLAVPDDLMAPDPGFVVRFRMRREALRETMGTWQPWRRLTLRLVPMTVAILLTAGVVVWSSHEPTSALLELETRELGDGMIEISQATATIEPILRIAFGEL